MKFQHFRKAVQIVATASIMITSGCATALVRDAGKPQHVFPATTFNAQFFWDCGVKGKPLFATLDRNKRNHPVARVANGIGAIVDLPFSIASDTILLPVDLFQSKTDAGRTTAKSEPDGSR
jgi:uncharacterized protein YceK